jgi:hypothetical protein
MMGGVRFQKRFRPTKKGAAKKKLLAIAVLAVTSWAAWITPAPAAAKKLKGKKVAYQRYDGYFEKNNSGLTGEASYLALTNQRAFDKVFGKGVVMGKKQKFLPADAFATQFVVAVIKRGKSIWTYDVKSARARGGKLFVRYSSTTKDSDGSARYASPLILSVDMGKYSAVVVIDNGKKVGTAEIGK